jgi:hypothetical protein
LPNRAVIPSVPGGRERVQERPPHARSRLGRAAPPPAANTESRPSARSVVEIPASESHATVRDRVAPLLSDEVFELVDAFVREVAVETVRAEFARATMDTRRREWYTVKEAAQRLGISEDAVRMRARRKRLVSRHQGRTLYVAAMSVDDIS